ncbi:MAG: hypothetical protein EPO21_16695 [Chloroflexota bacterium]|nr:MAG: hypothetical protein EPO21_16695 [Chloroflexota bacterium]
MKEPFPPRRPRKRIGGRIAAVHAQIILATLAVIVQLWLLTTALDVLLSGDPRPLWSFAAVSAVAFLGSLGLLLASHD